MSYYREGPVLLGQSESSGCGKGVRREYTQFTWSNQVSEGVVVVQLYLVGCSVPVAHIPLWQYHVR